MRLLLVPMIFFSVSFALLFSLSGTVDVPSSFEELVPWLQSFRSWAWAVGAGVIVVDSVLPMPFHPTLIALGVIYGPVVGGAVGGFASVASGVIGFGITRSLGRRAMVFIVGERELQRAALFFERWGFIALVVARTIAGPGEAVILLAGMSKMRFSTVLSAVSLGGFTTAFFFAGLGALAIDHPMLALLGGALFAALAVWLGWRVARSPRPGAGMSQPASGEVDSP